MGSMGLMSDKKQWTHAAAMNVAKDVLARLFACCERLAVAGSLRRLKPTVGDVEILYVPKLTRRPDGLFDERIVSVASEVIDGLLAEGYFAKRPSKTGVCTWGEANKLAVHTASGVPVDLFATTAENWWVALVIRTGSKQMNLELTAGANRLNRTLNAYGCGVTNRATGEVTPATSERHVFELCGVPYRELEDR